MASVAKQIERQLQDEHFSKQLNKQWRELPPPPDLCILPPKEVVEEAVEDKGPRIELTGNFRAVVMNAIEAYSSGIKENSAFGHWQRRQSEKLNRAGIDFGACRYTICAASYARGSNKSIDDIQIPLTPAHTIQEGTSILRGDGLLNVAVVLDGRGVEIFNEWMFAESDSVNVLDARSASDEEIYAYWEPLPAPLAPEPPKPTYRRTPRKAGSNVSYLGFTAGEPHSRITFAGRWAWKAVHLTHPCRVGAVHAAGQWELWMFNPEGGLLLHIPMHTGAAEFDDIVIPAGDALLGWRGFGATAGSEEVPTTHRPMVGLFADGLPTNPRLDDLLHSAPVVEPEPSTSWLEGDRLRVVPVPVPHFSFTAE
jgi:hypothetical protein